MTVKQVGVDEWESSLTGHRYTSKEAADKYDGDERMRREPESPGKKFLDSLSTPHLKSVIEELNFSAEEATSKPNWDKIQTDFVATTPSYVASPQNGGAMIAELTGRGKLTRNGVFTGTMQDLQDVFLDLVDRGVIVPKKGEAAPERPFDEAAAYSMPLPELERRIRGF